MKPPITYYGGKQKMVRHITPIIPPHKLYGEPFFGGGAFFFSKPASAVEVINDTNRELINFYRIVKSDFVSLEKEIQITLHSRSMHSDANVIYSNPHMFSEIKRAWAVWTLAAQSFSSMLDGSFGYDVIKNTTTKKITNKRESFTLDYAIRLQNVQIECTDALRIITSRDTKDSFFYCDPPYYNSNCGHYDGYSIEDFEALLKTLAGIEGKFLLSSYHSPILTQYTKQKGWMQKSFESQVSVNKGGNGKQKVEVLTANYDISTPYTTYSNASTT
jgi:DNA adenine methylase